MFCTIAMKWNVRATSVLDNIEAKNVMNINPLNFLREAMRFRSVSIPIDEALCLFCISGLDMATITSVEPSPEVRMN